MVSAKRALSRSYEAATHPRLADAREAEIYSVSSPLKRSGLIVMDRVVRRHPGFISRITGWQPTDENVAYGGFHTHVYRVDDETVVKVNKASMGMSPAERKAYADVLRAEHEALAEYVGDAILPQSVKVGAHPVLGSDTEAVLITQPFREIEYLNLIGAARDKTPLEEKLGVVQAAHPTVCADLGQIVTNSLKLYDDHRLLADVIGYQNVGFDMETGAMTIIDGQPIPDRDPGAQKDTLRLFDRLEPSLQALTA